MIDLEKPVVEESKANSETVSNKKKRDGGKDKRQEESKQKRLKELQKKYKKNWIGNDTFYKWN